MRDTELERECTVALDSQDALCSTAEAPDEEAAHKEEARAALRDIVMALVEALQPQEARVVFLFLLGRSAKQIEEETELSTATVYRIRHAAKTILKKIVKEYGIDIQLEDQPSLNQYLEDLVTMSLLERSTSVRSHLR